MHIIVPIKLVPDLVEELTIDESGKALDTTWLRLIINELDDHAIEQAILLKERDGAHITVIAPEMEGIDDVLFTALAKGADRAIKLSGDFAQVNNHALARIFCEAMKELAPDLILTGVQAHDDLDGSLGGLLAGMMDLPYVGYVSGVRIADSQAIVRKEYPGGLIAEMGVSLPAVLGIQAAEQPPRYVAVSKVRQAMKTASIDENEPARADLSGGVVVQQMFQPETGERATMIEGDVDEVASRFVEIFKELGIF